MISFEMEDLIGVLQGLVPYFIAIAVILVAAIAVSVAVKKLPRAKKKFIRGFVVSDFFRNNGHGFMNADQALANGVDAMLSTFAGGPNQVTDKSAASNVKYMREATHNILYTTVNSWAYDEEHTQGGMETWKLILITVDVVAVAAIAFGMFRKYKKYKAAK